MTTPAQGTVMVTGATSGIGLATARHLARAGWTVVLHGRELAGARAAATDVCNAAAGATVLAEAADLSSLDEVMALGERVTRRWGRLDALVNNAGVFIAAGDPSRRKMSADGYELTWAVNYLAAVALTLNLQRCPVTVVNLSSGMHLRATMAWQDPSLLGSWDGRAAYAQSKLALTMFTAALASGRVGAESTVVAVSPGYVDTKLVRAAFGGPAIPPHEGGRNVARLLTGAPVRSWNGQYVDISQPAAAHPLVTDGVARHRLWDMTRRQLAPWIAIATQPGDTVAAST